MNTPVVKEKPVLSAPTSRPAPEWLRELVSARAGYEERLGWPVTVRVTERRLAVALGTVVDAITMPEDLGTRVQAQLGIALLAGPVIGHRDGGLWTFLTQPVPPERDDFGDGLAEHDVRYAGAGSYTVVPASGTDRDTDRDTDTGRDTGAGWYWVSAPEPNMPPPSAYAVAATVRRVCAACR